MSKLLFLFAAFIILNALLVECKEPCKNPGEAVSKPCNFFIIKNKHSIFSN